MNFIVLPVSLKMKLQHQMVITLTRCNALVSLSQKRWVNPRLNLLFSILLFPSLSLIPIQPIRAAPIQKRLLQTPSIQTNALPLNSQIQETIKTELSQAYRRTFARLNLLLIVLLLLPTVSAVMAWFLLSRLGQKMMLVKQEIESLKEDAVFQLEMLMAETKTALQDLQAENALAEETLQKLSLQSHTPSTVELNGQHQNHHSLDLARDYAKQGEKLFIARDYEKAIQVYDQALELHPNLAEVWNNRGVILTKLQRYFEAITSYEKALEIRSDYPDAWNNRGVALGKLKSYQVAVESYDRAVQLKPDYADAWNNRGFALTKLEQYDEAITSYEKAADLNPNFHLVWYNQARCYGLQKKVDLAINHLKKAIQIKPESIRKLAKKEPDFELIRQEKRFQELVK